MYNVGKRSRNKGKRGELAFANLCKACGYKNARRTAQYNGKGGPADVVGLPGIHIEVKNVERMELWKWIEQAINDSLKTRNIPIVAHTKNRHGWLVTMRVEDWFKLYDAWEEQYEKAHKAQAFTTGDGTGAEGGNQGR